MNKKTIRIYIFGGLGNQLFQYSLATHLNKLFYVQVDTSQVNSREKDLKKILCFPALHHLSSAHNRLIKRNFNFLIRASTARKRNVLLNFIIILSSAAHSVYLFFETGKYYRPYIADGLNDFQVSLDENKNYFVIGYFQTYHFHDYDSISLNLGYETESIKRFSSIYAPDTDIVVHIRVGDYLKENKFGVLSSEYYESSIENLQKLGFTGNIFFFSEDFNMAKDYLSIIVEKNFKYIEMPNDIETLYALACAKALVMSNSTFCWWAAKLSIYNMSNQFVICPSPWFKRIPMVGEFLPGHWIRNKAEFLE